MLNRRHVPRISLDYAFEHKETGEITVLKDQEISPQFQFPSSTYNKLYETASIKASLVFNMLIFLFFYKSFY